MNSIQPLIDLDTMLSERVPGLYRWMPKPLLSGLKRLIRQEEVNRIIQTYGHTPGLPFVEDILTDLRIQIYVEGSEHLNPNKKYVFASNHPLGGIDGLAMIQTVGKLVGSPKAIINDLLLHISPLRDVFLGVNIYGKASRKHLQEIDTLYESDLQVIVFPAGMVSRKIEGKVQDLEWKKSFLSKAIQHGRDIVPTFIDAKNSKIFYRASSIRQRLRLAFPYELILLPREFFEYSGQSLTIRFGKPIPIESFTSSKSKEQWTLHLRKLVYQLQHNS